MCLHIYITSLQILIRLSGEVEHRLLLSNLDKWIYVIHIYLPIFLFSMAWTSGKLIGDEALCHWRYVYTAIRIVNINPFFRQLSSSLGNISRMLRELRLSPLLTLVNKKKRRATLQKIHNCIIARSNSFFQSKYLML